MSATPQPRTRGDQVVLGNGEPSQRQRLITAMGQVAAEQGRRAATVEAACERAGMSKRSFYEHFTDGEQCFVSAVGQAFDQLFAAIDLVASRPLHWEDRACALIAGLIAALDGDRTMARLCVVESHCSGPVARSIRNAAVHRLALVLAAGATVGNQALGDAAARGAIGAIFELVTDPIAAGAPLQEVMGPAVYLGLVPFAGRRTASARAAHAPQMFPPRQHGPRQEGDGRTAIGQLLVTELTRQTVLHLADHPDARNVDIARAVGVRHGSQMSRHLARLERAGVVGRRKDGRTNAWRLTALGREAARAFGDGSRS
jgi:AcrR family transcriptional regulator/DNA-binding transcriptional ArsR family regulator